MINDINPNEQKKLFAYEKEFKFFINLYENKKLPNKILIKGKKGIGKSTFAFHLINFILSRDEKFSYDINKLEINNLSKTYNLIKQSVHPNLFNLYLNDKKKNIEIDSIREVIKFNNHTTLYENKKIILIDDAEFLNRNSSNALLKIIEEPNPNTIIILILDSSKKILETLNSRFVSFNFNLNFNQSIEIANKIIGKNIYDFISDDYLNLFLTPGFIIQLYNFSFEEKLDLKNISYKDFIRLIIEKSLYKKNNFLINNFNKLIEIYLNRLIKISDNKERIYINYNKLINNLNFANKYNLDKDNIYYEFKSKFLNA